MALNYPREFLNSTDLFVAYLSAPTGAVTGNNTPYNIICDSVYANLGGNYDTTTGIYTAPTNGIRLVAAEITCFDTGANPSLDYELGIYGTAADFILEKSRTAANQQTLILSKKFPVYMLAGETIGLRIKMNGAGSDNVQLYGQVPKSGAGSYALATVFSVFTLPPSD